MGLLGGIDGWVEVMAWWDGWVVGRGGWTGMDGWDGWVGWLSGMIGFDG